MRPHVEKKFLKILKIGQVIAIFVRLTKIQKRVNKNQENAFSAIFELTPKNVFFIYFGQSGQNIMSLLNWNIQIPPPLSTD